MSSSWLHVPTTSIMLLLKTSQHHLSTQWKTTTILSQKWWSIQPILPVECQFLQESATPAILKTKPMGFVQQNARLNSKKSLQNT